MRLMMLELNLMFKKRAGGTAKPKDIPGVERIVEKSRGHSVPLASAWCCTHPSLGDLHTEWPRQPESGTVLLYDWPSIRRIPTRSSLRESPVGQHWDKSRRDWSPWHGLDKTRSSIWFTALSPARQPEAESWKGKLVEEQPPRNSILTCLPCVQHASPHKRGFYRIGRLCINTGKVSLTTFLRTKYRFWNT